MKKDAKKKMTIDDLAIVMAGSFDGFEKRLTKKIDDVENGLRKEVEGVKKKVEGVKNQLEGTNKRIDDFAETKASKITYKELENRVNFMEKKLEIKKQIVQKTKNAPLARGVFWYCSLFCFVPPLRINLRGASF